MWPWNKKSILSFQSLQQNQVLMIFLWYLITIFPRILLLPCQNSPSSSTYIYKAPSESGEHSCLIAIFRALPLSTRKTNKQTNKNIFSHMTPPSAGASASSSSTLQPTKTEQFSTLLCSSYLPPFPSCFENLPFCFSILFLPHTSPSSQDYLDIFLLA